MTSKNTKPTSKPTTSPTTQDIAEVKKVPSMVNPNLKPVRPVQPPQQKMPQHRPPTFRPMQSRKSIGR